MSMQTDKTISWPRHFQGWLFPLFVIHQVFLSCNMFPYHSPSKINNGGLMVSCSTSNKAVKYGSHREIITSNHTHVIMTWNWNYWNASLSNIIYDDLTLNNTTDLYWWQHSNTMFQDHAHVYDSSYNQTYKNVVSFQ